MTDQQRHVFLSWEIIKHKLLYYKPEVAFVNRQTDQITDDQYDLLEREYLDLCLKLDEPNTVVHKDYPGIKTKGEGMMEVDMERPSVKLTYMKMRGITL